jgi:hypothetical protein
LYGSSREERAWTSVATSFPADRAAERKGREKLTLQRAAASDAASAWTKSSAG